MSSLQVQLRSDLIGLIKPLHKPSVKLTNLTNSKSYDLAHQLYFELEQGPQYQYSPGFIKFGMVSPNGLEISTDENKRLVDAVHNELLQTTKKEVDKAMPAFEDFGQGITKTSPHLLEFLYYVIASKHECENIELSGEEAQNLSEIFSTLAKYYPYNSLVISLSNNIAPNMIIHNTHRTFQKLSDSFKELAEKKLTDSNTKLSLNNIIVSK